MSAFVGRGQPTGFVNLSRHERCVCIGDVHGDLWPFLSVLEKAELIRCSEEIREACQICPTSKSEKDRTGYPITKDQAKSIEWIGGSSVAVFTGDVLDNRRSSRQDKFGVCAYTGTQQMILYLLWTLNKKARRSKGRVILVLGNHDVANYVYDKDNGMCRNYAPQRSFRENEENENYDTCAEEGHFSSEHTRRMAKKIVDRAVAILRITLAGKKRKSDTMPSVLVMHGGLCRLDILSSEEFGEVWYRIEEDASPQTNVDRINRIFWDAAQGNEVAADIIRKYTEILPIWCRPTRIDNADEMRRYFGTARLIKAHDVQSTANCNIMGERTGKSETIMADGELCRIDVAMSRAFGSARSGKFAYCELRKEDETIVRKIVEWTP